MSIPYRLLWMSWNGMCKYSVCTQLHCNECNESIHGGKFIGLTVCALCLRACVCVWFKLGAHCGVRFIHTNMAYCKMMIVRTHNDTFEQYFSASFSWLKQMPRRNVRNDTIREGRKNRIKNVFERACSHGNCILPTTMTQYAHTYAHAHTWDGMESKGEKKCDETKPPTHIVQLDLVLFYFFVYVFFISFRTWWKKMRIE